MFNDQGIMNLTMAVVKSACQDYALNCLGICTRIKKKDLKKERGEGKSTYADWVKSEKEFHEKFFRESPFMAVLNIDPEFIIQQIQKDPQSVLNKVRESQRLDEKNLKRKHRLEGDKKNKK